MPGRCGEDGPREQHRARGTRAAVPGAIPSEPDGAAGRPGRAPRVSTELGGPALRPARGQAPRGCTQRARGGRPRGPGREARAPRTSGACGAPPGCGAGRRGPERGLRHGDGGARRKAPGPRPDPSCPGTAAPFASAASRRRRTRSVFHRNVRVSGTGRRPRAAGGAPGRRTAGAAAEDAAHARGAGTRFWRRALGVPASAQGTRASGREVGGRRGAATSSGRSDACHAPGPHLPHRPSPHAPCPAGHRLGRPRPLPAPDPARPPCPRPCSALRGQAGRAGGTRPLRLRELRQGQRLSRVGPGSSHPSAEGEPGPRTSQTLLSGAGVLPGRRSRPGAGLGAGLGWAGAPSLSGGPGRAGGRPPPRLHCQELGELEGQAGAS